MTSTSARTRRAVALSATGVLVAGLAWLPAGPASATVAATFTAGGHASTAPGCALTSGNPDPIVSTAAFSQGTVGRSVDLFATFTNTGDPTDVVHASGHYSGSTTVTKNGGDLRSVVLSGTGWVSTDGSRGSSTACDPSAYVAVGTQLRFDESHAGWLYVRRSTVAEPGLAETILVNDTGSGAPVVFDVYQGGASRARTRGFVRPGTYAGDIVVGLTTGNAVVPARTPRSSSTSVRFFPAGSASSGTAGAGRAYLSFPGAVSCATHRATLRWRPRATRVASGTFYVNGREKASVTRPTGGQRVVLGHLARTADAALVARLRLKNGRTVSAERRYVPCTG